MTDVDVVDAGAGSRAASRVLGTVLVVVGLVTVPISVLFGLVVLNRGRSDADLPDILIFVLPVAIGYPLAVALWFAVRRRTSGWAAWVLAIIGVLVVLAASMPPVGFFVHGLYLEWLETQPGGRGYSPPG